MTRVANAKAAPFAVMAIVILGLLVAMALRPDDGTAVTINSAPPAADSVGANHAKPLPRAAVPVDLVRIMAFAIATLLVVACSECSGLQRSPRHLGRSPSLTRSLSLARRGPPALV